MAPGEMRYAVVLHTCCRDNEVEMQPVQLILEHRDQRAKVLQSAHVDSPVLISNVDMQATESVDEELEYRNKKFHCPLDFFQNRTRGDVSDQLWCMRTPSYHGHIPLVYL